MKTVTFRSGKIREVSLDSFEKLIQSRIKKIQPKSKQRGYAKDLIEKLYPTIESALGKGCSYEEIADAISDRVKISPVTLKQYHQANKRKSQFDDSEIENQVLLSYPEEETSDFLAAEKEKIASQPTSFAEDNTTKKSTLTSTILTGASLTDEDYLDDFNDY